MAGLDRFDVIFDAVGTSSFVSCRPLLAPGGTYVTTLPTPSLFFWSGVQSIAGIFSNAKRANGILVRPSGKDLAYLCQLADEGKLRPRLVTRTKPTVLLLTTDFRGLDVVRRIEIRVATIDRTPRECDRATMPR